MKTGSRFVFTAALIVVLGLGLVSTARAQPIEYEIRFDNADHHEAEVRLRLESVPSGTLELRMSRSSPGRYALHEFAKNVYDVHVSDGRGRELEPSRPDPHGWNVDGHDGTVEVRYKIFGDRCDGTYLAIDSTHAHMNMPATFMWPRGLGDRRIRLRIVPPKEDWKVATQLQPTGEPFTFEALNLYYFLDSPTEVSAFELHVWDVGGATIQLALHHAGTEAEGAAYAKLAEAIVREQAAMFGELPEFDFGTYTFIADYLPYVDGDGMEHRNSTILSTNRALDPHAVRNLGTVSHEFFHAWNVERPDAKSLTAAIKVFAPSDSTTIVFEKRGERREAELVFEQNPHIEVVPFERIGKDVTPEIESFRRAWLGSSLTHVLERHCHECGRSFAFENAFCAYDGKALKIVPKH